jgi:hypothetical protein
MIKKMMLLAMAVGALLAFGAPATASAGTWDTNGIPLGNEASADSVHFTGTLSSTKSGLKISCDATVIVDLWNTGGVGHGRVTSLALTSDPTPTSGCTVGVNVGGGTYVDVTECHVNAAAKGLVWTFTTSGNHVTIDSANFTNKFSGAGCQQHLGIPNNTEVSDFGNATGVVESECIVFNNSGTFVGGSTIDGLLCPINAPGLELTP